MKVYGIDFDKLLGVFDKDNEYYDRVTSQELRFALSKYLEHPNLKFVIHDHVVELPNYIKDKIKEITENEE